MATQILGKVGMLLKGAYDSTVTYQKLDVVTYQGSSYSAKLTTLGNVPTNTTYWQEIAQKGTDGATPQKGVDYYTSQDIADMESDVVTAITPTLDAKQNKTDNTLQTTSKTVTGAINEVNSVAKGANQALSYSNYSAMITAFNSASSTAYNVGQNIYIETLEVPDLWVYKIESSSSSYTYTTDEAFTTALATSGYVQVGYYKLSALETQKVDLTGYAKTTDVPTALSQLSDDSTHRLVTDTEKTTWNGKLSTSLIEEKDLLVTYEDTTTETLKLVVYK